MRLKVTNAHRHKQKKGYFPTEKKMLSIEVVVSRARRPSS